MDPETAGITGARRFVPEGRLSLGRLASAATNCRGCPLWRGASQVVFGEGSRTAELMLVGEQPGDREDRDGRPFVGPAGLELNRILDETGIERDRLYVTNAVKHFKFHREGKRRIHDKPTRNEVKACRPWLDRELELVQPRAVVALGATAGRELFGPGFRVTRHHGQFLENGPAEISVGTIHPSAIIRARDPDREAYREMLTGDLCAVIERLSS